MYRQGVSVDLARQVAIDHRLERCLEPLDTERQFPGLRCHRLEHLELQQVVTPGRVRLADVHDPFAAQACHQFGQGCGFLRFDNNRLHQRQRVTPTVSKRHGLSE